MLTPVQKYTAYFTLLIAWCATLGSLFFSEILKYPPCVLCWYQRICMYPLIVILSVGILRKNKDLPWFVLPLGIIGFGIAVYHNLLYYKILPESAAPCTLGVSCTTKFIEYFGFITIPFLSLLAFGGVIFAMIVFLKYGRKEN